MIKVIHCLLTVTLAIFLFRCPPAAADEEHSEMIDSIVATVHNEIITLEDVRIETEILRRTKKWFSQPTVPISVTQKMVFDEILARAFLYHQARKMGFSEVSDADLNRMLQEFRSTFGSAEAYKRWLLKFEMRDETVSIPENISYKYYRLIEKRFFRRLIIEQYLAKKIGIQIKLALSQFLEDHRQELQSEYPHASEAQLRDVARERLYSEKLLVHIEELRAQSHFVILRDLFR